MSSETPSAVNSVALAVGVFQMDKLKPGTWKIRMTRTGSWSEEQADEHLDKALMSAQAQTLAAWTAPVYIMVKSKLKGGHWAAMGTPL